MLNNIHDEEIPIYPDLIIQAVHSLPLLVHALCYSPAALLRYTTVNCIRTFELNIIQESFSQGALNINEHPLSPMLLFALYEIVGT